MRNNARVINEPFSTIPHSHQSLDGRYPRKYVHKKLFTQESSSSHGHSNTAISNISKNINSVLGKHASLNADVSRSEHFINPHAEGKDSISSVFSNKFMNKESEGNYRGQREGCPELLAKRSVQILIGLQKGGINKTQYSKINRRKEELFKRNVVPYKWDKSDAQIQHLEDISDEMLLEKYRELVIKKDGLKPFNLINKLYQIEALTSKECIVSIPRDVIKVVATNCGQSRKNSDIEHKINRIIHKPTEAKAVKEMLAWHSDKGLLTETSAMDGQHSSIAKKPPSQELRRASRATGFPVKSLKRETEGAFGDKSQTGHRMAEVRMKAQMNSKIDACSKMETPQKLQPQVLYPPPKKVSSSAYIVYEMLQRQTKRCPTKRNEFESIKRKDYSGVIHSSLNIKTASEIASLTKIMTCTVVIEICERLRINPHLEKYKVGYFESYIRGTTAEIEVGDIYTIDQLLRGLMLPSGNDASLALARWAGNVLLLTDQEGDKRKAQPKPQVQLKPECSPEHWATGNRYLRFKCQKLKPKRCFNRFIAEMNKKGRLMGLERTSYVNSHGLSNPHNKSCCLDMAILCEQALRNRYFCEIIGCKEYEAIIDREVVVSSLKGRKKGNRLINRQDPEQDNLEEDVACEEHEEEDNDEDVEEEEDSETETETLPAGKTVSVVGEVKVEMTKKTIFWTNTHRLLQEKECYLGIKTGVTTTAGPCLASYLQLGSRKFVIIVLNSKKLSQRFVDTEILRQWLSKKEKLCHETKPKDK